MENQTRKFHKYFYSAIEILDKTTRKKYMDENLSISWDGESFWTLDSLKIVGTATRRSTNFEMFDE